MVSKGILLMHTPYIIRQRAVTIKWGFRVAAAEKRIEPSQLPRCVYATTYTGASAIY